MTITQKLQERKSEKKSARKSGSISGKKSAGKLTEKAPRTNSRTFRGLALAYAILCIFNVATLTLYIGFEPEGALFNAFGALWALAIPLGAWLLAAGRGRHLPAIVWSAALTLYTALRTVSGLRSHFQAQAGDDFYLLAQGLPLFIFLVVSVWVGFYLFFTRKDRRKLLTAVCVILTLAMIVASVILTYVGFSSVGIIHTSSYLEHRPALLLTGNLVLVAMLWTWRLLGDTDLYAGRAVLVTAMAVLLGINALGGGYQLFSAFAASLANEAESNGITTSNKLQKNPFTGTGSRGLFKQNNRIVSYYYYVPLSVPMALAGYEQYTSDMKVTRNAGNWHAATHDGITLKYDVYRPTWTKQKTPVIINLHGHHSYKQYWDSYEQFVDSGFTIIDVQYGNDDPKLKVGSRRYNWIPGYSYRGPNYDLWVQDMEHLFRYLKQHENDLKIDLNQTFLYGHSYGAYMAVGMDNVLRGLGYTDVYGDKKVARYNKYAAYYTGKAAAPDVENFVNIRGMILMYGIDGRYFNSGLDPILFCYGRSDKVMKLEYTEQMFKMRDVYNIPHCYIMCAGAASHGFDYVSGNALCNQLTLRYAGMFLERWRDD